MKRTHLISELNPSDLNKKIVIAGWIEDIRKMGSIIFITIRDYTEITQVIFRKSHDKFELIEKIPRQSIIYVQGKLKSSNARDFNFEIDGEDIEIVSEANHPLPIDPTGRIISSTDIRIDARALDVRNPKVSSIFKIRHGICKYIREYLIDEGFIEINTTKIIGQAVEGGANLFKLNYFGRNAYLSQSPQLYKEQLTLSLERVFEIADYFRAEKSNTTRHISEFTSVDIESAFMNQDDVMTILEKMINVIIKKLNIEYSKELNILEREIKIPKTPFKKISYEDVINKLKDTGLKIEFGDDLTDSALSLIGKTNKEYYFIVDWPNNLKPFYIKSKDNSTQISTGFDLQYGKMELCSGGMRIHKKDELISKLKKNKLDINSFKNHINTFNWGMPPHSGWGFGLDRFLMIITGTDNIREVVLFPRDPNRLTP